MGDIGLDLRDFLNDGCGDRIYHQGTVFSYQQTKRNIAPIVFTLHSVLVLSSLYFLGKLCGVVFCMDKEYEYEEEQNWQQTM